MSALRGLVVSNAEVKIVPASYEMVKYACLNYHYSKTVPVGRKVSFAIFENGSFIGVIIYSTGANNNIAKPYNLEQGEVVELTRIALKEHENFVSHYLARTLRILKEISPRVKIIVSYADICHQGHHGSIYQATNWIYTGVAEQTNVQYWYKGKWTHKRTIDSLKEPDRTRLLKTLPTREASKKHRYIFVLDKRLRKQYLKTALPYPSN